MGQGLLELFQACGGSRHDDSPSRCYSCKFLAGGQIPPLPPFDKGPPFPFELPAYADWL